MFSRDNERYDEAKEMLRKARANGKVELCEDNLRVAVTLYTIGVC